MDKEKMKKILIPVLVVVAIAVVVFMNLNGGSYNGTFHLDSEGWETVDYTVSEGDADKLAIELKDDSTLTVDYSGEFPLQAAINLTGADGSTAVYNLHLYVETETDINSNSTTTIMSELDRAE